MDVIRIETRCNQNCLFCGADPQNLGDYVFDFQELKTLVANAGRDEVIEISGGEPTLSPILPRLLLYAKKLGRRISLQTNAMRFSERRFAKTMVKAGLTHAFISLHAPEARLSDALTRRAGGFDLTVSGAKNLIAEGVHVSFNYVICKSNKKKLSDYVKFINREFGPGRVLVFSFINPFHNAWKTPAMIPAISEIQDDLFAALDEGERLGLEMHLPDICGIPLCFLRTYERFADKYEAILQERPFSPHPEKVKGGICKNCVWDALCDGLWERYADMYGFDELDPVLEKPSAADSGRRRGPTQCIRREEPKHVRDTALLIGEGCVNDCIFCNEGGKRAKRRSMTLDEQRRLLQEAKPDWVFLSGGEPTTNPRLLESIELAKSCGAGRITLVSNGFRLSDPAYSESVVKAGVDEVRLSIHGPDAATHDAQTRRPGSFDDQVKAAHNLNRLKKSYDLRTVALVVINRMNLDVLAQTVRLFIELGFDKIGLGLVEPRRNALEHFSEVVPRYSEAASKIEALFEEFPDGSVDIYVDSLPPCLLKRKDIPLGERSVIQTIDDNNGEFREMSETRDKIYGPPCEGCSGRKICEGVFEAYVRRYGWAEFRKI